eukprot:CAMPEP_0185730762 /NCGR_PEP_ID=MMETSP1171-20130828/10930_1 /TAXON_ID=374046 /ORGANISM="Helicotheca tamensis, Strain CCMP826" /LENGTH=200 /DNA_ID=CAMNT_0028399885 /DNA_START=13 /DNA_END=615 /DNA_ORIENTATION=+
MNLLTIFASFALMCLVSQVSADEEPEETVAEILIELSGDNDFDNNKYDYDLFLKGLELCGFVDELSDRRSVYTVFAPRDKAFFRFAKDLGYPGQGNYDEEAIWDFFVNYNYNNNADAMSVLKSFLLYHVSPGYLDSVDFEDVETVTTYINETITPRGLDPVILVDVAESLPNPRLTDPFDLIASNGIIHTIKYILVPFPL